MQENDDANDNIDHFDHAYHLAWNRVFESGHVKQFEVGKLLANVCGFPNFPNMRQKYTKKTVKKLELLNSEHAYTLCQVMIVRQQDAIT